MPDIRSVAVFCGASTGHLPAYREGAIALGQGLARAGLRLVYGGGRVGLMGAVADGAIAAGGNVVGIIPEFLTRSEVAHAGVAEMIVTDSMHSRKRLMFEMSDAFVSFPGGLGTMDETFEILTWRQLGLHDKPILLTDVAGSSAPLVAMIEATIDLGFARPEIRRLYEVVAGVDATLERLAHLTLADGPRAGGPLTNGGAGALL
jgi:uncharacterized protein (TIGR00730 family)